MSGVLKVGSIKNPSSSLDNITLNTDGTINLSNSPLIAKTNITQNYSVPQTATATTDNDLSFDLSARLFFNSTPTAGGALTFTSIPTNVCWVTIKLVNTANYDITAGSGTKVTASFLNTISASGTYIISGYCDGTSIHCSTAGAST